MKRIFAVLMAFLLVIALCGCEIDTSTTVVAEDNDSDTKLSFVGEFYDNHGEQYLSVEGTSFNISPNKVKEYYYDDSGTWTYHWTMSSVMSVDIDGKDIESCGSTILIYDTRLRPEPCEIPEAEVVSSVGDTATLVAPSDIRLYDAWSVGWWWYNTDVSNHSTGSRIVVIQSQEGDPICLFSGNNVSWDVSRNLPKTTEITIDGLKLFVHRANFSIIDTNVFGGID